MKEIRSDGQENNYQEDFTKTSTVGSISTLAASKTSQLPISTHLPETAKTVSELPVVSIVKIKDGEIERAVEEAIDLLGGIESLTQDKVRIMLKPNLVSNDPRSTTKPQVIRALVQLMKDAGKEVSIGEGSAAADGFNFKNGDCYRTKNPETLHAMQQFVFDTLGYTELSRSLDVPLINLNFGDMVEVAVPNGFAYQKITLHRLLTEIDLLCSVPMMKTHVLATVTLGMKNLIGLYPGIIYKTVRAGVHDHSADAGSPGVAFEIIDMVRVNKLGLVVIDGSTAMEGNGPSDGDLLPMDIIIAGANPLATDMIAANVMGFEPEEIPTFVWARKAGMQPQNLDEVEVRGEKISSVRRPFKKPELVTWNEIRSVWGVKEMV